MRTRLVVSVTALAIALVGCDRIEQTVLRIMLEPGSADSVAGVEVISDLVYSQTPHGELLLDLYRPSDYSGAPLPVVVFFFGGAFEMGNKHQLGLYDVQTLPLDGFAVVSIDYRLSDQAIFPAQLIDAESALRWVASHAAEYNLDSDRIGVWGMSAGGMLAALLGAGGAEQLDAGSSAPRVQAVVDYYGPTDFLQGDAHAPEGIELGWQAAESWPSRYLGGRLADHPERVQATNPLTYVSANDPPFLIVHGDQDEIVPLHQSELLFAALTEAGVDAELYVVEGGGHARGGEFGSAALHRRTVRFLQQHLQ